MSWDGVLTGDVSTLEDAGSLLFRWYDLICTGARLWTSMGLWINQPTVIEWNQQVAPPRGEAKFWPAGPMTPPSASHLHQVGVAPVTKSNLLEIHQKQEKGS